MTVLRPRYRRGSTHTQTGSINITSAPESVWDLITTVDTIPEWYDTWDAVDHDTTDPRLRMGTVFRLIRHRRGRDDTARCRVTDLTAPTRLQWEQSALHKATVSVTFLLIADPATITTQLHHSRAWTTP